jgi:phospholipid/cholesterol/gamma-HCH transport system substrate-binding protein
VNKTEQTLDSFQRSLANVEDVFGDEKVRDSLKQAISRLPELFEDTRGAIATIRTTVESVDRNLTNLEGLTGPLGERGEHIVSRVDEAVVRLDELLSEMSDFGRKLNSGEGSLGQLMRNPELYQHLSGAVRNIEQITRELKPILADARVFSDKIARHPELLGVRGAIQKSPGTK